MASLTVGNSALLFRGGKPRACALCTLKSVWLPELRETSPQTDFYAGADARLAPASATVRKRRKPRWQPPQRPRAPFTRQAAFVSRIFSDPPRG